MVPDRGPNRAGADRPLPAGRLTHGGEQRATARGFAGRWRSARARGPRAQYVSPGPRGRAGVRADRAQSAPSKRRGRSLAGAGKRCKTNPCRRSDRGRSHVRLLDGRRRSCTSFRSRIRCRSARGGAALPRQTNGAQSVVVPSGLRRVLPSTSQIVLVGTQSPQRGVAAVARGAVAVGRAGSGAARRALTGEPAALLRLGAMDKIRCRCRSLRAWTCRWRDRSSARGTSTSAPASPAQLSRVMPSQARAAQGSLRVPAWHGVRSPCGSARDRACTCRPRSPRRTPRTGRGTARRSRRRRRRSRSRSPPGRCRRRRAASWARSGRYCNRHSSLQSANVVQIVVQAPFDAHESAARNRRVAPARARTVAGLTGDGVVDAGRCPHGAPFA